MGGFTCDLFIETNTFHYPLHLFLRSYINSPLKAIGCSHRRGIVSLLGSNMPIPVERHHRLSWALNQAVDDKIRGYSLSADGKCGVSTLLHKSVIII